MMNPEMIGGVVQGTVIAENKGTNPVARAKYVIIPERTGIPINGRAKKGFITIGVPNKIGSLMLKIPGTPPNFPNSLHCLDLAKKIIYVTNPIVNPAPVTVMN